MLQLQAEEEAAAMAAAAEAEAAGQGAESAQPPAAADDESYEEASTSAAAAAHRAASSSSRQHSAATASSADAGISATAEKLISQQARRYFDEPLAEFQESRTVVSVDLDQFERLPFGAAAVTHESSTGNGSAAPVDLFGDEEEEEEAQAALQAADSGDLPPAGQLAGAGGMAVQGSDAVLDGTLMSLFPDVFNPLGGSKTIQQPAQQQQQRQSADAVASTPSDATSGDDAVKGPAASSDAKADTASSDPKGGAGFTSAKAQPRR